MKLRLILIAALVPTVAHAQAKPVERWECREKYSQNDAVLVRATVDSGRHSGTLTVAGVTYTTAFEVAGFNRRWDFGPKGDRWRYAFIIDPEGDGSYYDFTSKTSGVMPSLILECRQ